MLRSLMSNQTALDAEAGATTWDVACVLEVVRLIVVFSKFSEGVVGFVACLATVRLGR